MKKNSLSPKNSGDIQLSPKIEPEKIISKSVGAIEEEEEAPPINQSANIMTKFFKTQIFLLPAAALVFVVVIVAGAILFYKQNQKSQPSQIVNEQTKSLTDEIKDEIMLSEALAQNFAAYEDTAVNINPKIPEYTVAVGLSNVTNKDRFKFSEKAADLLVKNGFVVVLDQNDEFFPIYESNRYEKIPSFITADSVLHNYHLAFDFLLRTVEKNKLVAEATNLSASMLDVSKSQYDQLKGTEWENAAKRNAAFFAVASKLFAPETAIPEYVNNEVEAELKLIEAHAAISESVVMNIGLDSQNDLLIETGTPEGSLPLNAFKEDYSQYIVRGHYATDGDLQKYFRGMMYLGRMTFRLKSSDETKSAVLITTALTEDSNRYNLWNRIYEPTTFFVGKSDDLTFYDYSQVLKSVYGTEQVSLDLIKNDPEKFKQFLKLAQKLNPPQVNSMPIFAPGIQNDREKEIKGFRVMGQRFTLDASIFQRLIYREVGNKKGVIPPMPDETTRMLPKGLDIMAAMGSKEAESIVQSLGEKEYYLYPENLSKMQTYIAGLSKSVWTQNLYWGWLYSLNSLIETKGEGWPFFMQNQAWARKELNTYLGSWTELKRDTILYAKQVYAELGGGGEDKKIDDRGYVEPNPYVYAKLVSLIKMTKEGLQIRGLLTEENVGLLDRMSALVLRLKEISEKELNNETITDADYELIRAYGGSLESFWLETFKDKGIVSKSQLSDEPAPIIADVATSPEGFVLEEGTGYVAEIYAVVPVDGKPRLAKGGVYTQYEFIWPLDDRLTDQKWREKLQTEGAPPLADWTKVFILPEESVN